MKTICRILALCVMTLAVACNDDPARPGGSSTDQVFLPLTTRSAVLNNLELAWTARRTDKVDELLDENFTFFFAPGDVGGNIPDRWFRVDELDATSRLFNSNQQPDPPFDPVCRRVLVDIAFDDETVWEPVSPEDFPGETWYFTTVLYTYTIEIEPDITFIPMNGARAVHGARCCRR